MTGASKEDYLVKGRARRGGPPGTQLTMLRLVLLALKAQMLHAVWSRGQFADVRPGLLVIGQDELIGACVDDVALYASRIGKQHEGMSLLGRRCRVHHRLG